MELQRKQKLSLGHSKFRAMKKHETRNMIFVFTALALLLGGGIYLYLMSRTYIKAWRLGVPMTAAAFQSIVGRSVPALVGMVGAAFLIAVISLSFQTMTNSKILTPSMIGFDAIFVGTQTLLVFVLGTTTQFFTNPYLNYLVSAGAMVTVSFFMYRAILRKGKNNTIFLLMFGLVLSGIVSNLARYLQTIMSVYEFNHVQAAVNVTVNNMNTRIIYMVIPMMAVLCVVIMWRHRKYNVMTLGRDQARGLGVDYERELHLNLIFIAIGMSLATALIGSLTFLGLLAVNLSRMILKTHRHLPLFIASGLVAAVALVLGQTTVELLEHGLPVTVIINLVGCTYLFLYILKENKV